MQKLRKYMRMTLPEVSSLCVENRIDVTAETIRDVTCMPITWNFLQQTMLSKIFLQQTMLSKRYDWLTDWLSQSMLPKRREVYVVVLTSFDCTAEMIHHACLHRQSMPRLPKRDLPFPNEGILCSLIRNNNTIYWKNYELCLSLARFK